MSGSKFAGVDRQIAAGDLWRAKEMLQGALTNADFDPDLLEKYGQVLLAMGDKLEAGRYLFVSGIRRPEYMEPIELFLSRTGRKDTQLTAALPAMVARHRGILFSTITSQQFIENGYPSAVLKQLEDLPTRSAAPLKRSRGSDTAGKIVIISVLLLLAGCAALGAATAVRWLYSVAFENAPNG